MLRLLSVIALTQLALALVVPGPASAQRETVPPGLSEADQYLEALPDGEGDSAPDHSSEPRDVFSDKQVAELDGAGADGAAVAALAAATAPPSGRSGAAGGADGQAGADEESAQGGAKQSEGGAGGPATASSAVPAEGLGSWLWVIVIAALLGGTGYAAFRWRANRVS